MNILFIKLLFITCLTIFIILVIINELFNYIIKAYYNYKYRNGIK